MLSSETGGASRTVEPSELAAFRRSRDTLRIYHRDELIFSSRRERLQPLLDYLATAPLEPGVTVLDRVTGNAAALLAVCARAASVYSPVGSRHAARTLTDHGLDYRFDVIVSEVRRADGGACPMEALSLGRTPDEFYALLRARSVTLKGRV